MHPSKKSLALSTLVMVAATFSCALYRPGSVVGGPGTDPGNTTHPCEGRAEPCPNGFDCPPLSNPTGPCEWHQWEPGPNELAKKPDAGEPNRCVCPGGAIGWWCGAGKCACVEAGFPDCSK